LNLARCSSAARSPHESLHDSPSFDKVNYGLAGAMAAVHSPPSSARASASRPLLASHDSLMQLSPRTLQSFDKVDQTNQVQSYLRHSGSADQGLRRPAAQEHTPRTAFRALLPRADSTASASTSVSEGPRPLPSNLQPGVRTIGKPVRAPTPFWTPPPEALAAIDATNEANSPSTGFMSPLSPRPVSKQGNCLASPRQRRDDARKNSELATCRCARNTPQLVPRRHACGGGVTAGRAQLSAQKF